MQHRPIETRVIGGFLGAGKTTCIIEQLKHAKGRTAVVVNDFGKLAMDGDVIRQKGGVEVVEIEGGCICCSQRFGLLSSIRQIANELNPELLLIEPSGVAEMSELLKVLSDPSLEGIIDVSTVVTVVDAETFLEFSDPEAFGLFFIDQVRCADLVLVNKCDLVGTAVLDRISGSISFHNPDAVVLKTRFCRIEGSLPAPVPRRKRYSGSPEPLGVSCLNVTPPHPFSEEGLSRFLDEMRRGRFGRIMRGKGFLNVAGRGWINLQIVSGKAKMKKWPAMVTPRLILIGFGLKSDELDLFFGDACNAAGESP